MNKTLVLLLAVIGLAGCSLFGGVVEKIADTVDDYCVKEPYSQRQVYRETINDELATKGHRIDVSCAGDPEPQTNNSEAITWDFSKGSAKQSLQGLVPQVRPKSLIILLARHSYGVGNTRYIALPV